MTKFVRDLLITGTNLLFCISLNAMQLADFRVNPKNNNIEIKMMTFCSKNDEQQKKDVLLDLEIYRDVTDEDGNHSWIEDDATYSYSPNIAYLVSEKKPNITIPWIGNDPIMPSKRYKIVMKKRNPDKNSSHQIIFEKIFEVEKLNI